MHGDELTIYLNLLVYVYGSRFLHRLLCLDGAVSLKLAHHLMGRTAIHGERRAHEMEEVSDTLRAIGVEPMMSDAAAKRIHWAAGKGLKETFADGAPSDYRDVIKAIRAFDDKAANRE